MQDYWQYKFRDTGLRFSQIDGTFERPLHINSTANTESNYTEYHKSLTPLQLKWNSYLSMACMIPKIGILMINAAIGHKIAFRPKLLVSLIGIIFLFILTDVMTKVNTDGFQDAFLSLTLVSVVLLTSFSGVLQVIYAYTYVTFISYYVYDLQF